MTINMTTFTYPVELSVTEQPIKLAISNLMYQAHGSDTGGAVSSVNGQTGTVNLSASDVGAATTAQGGKADTALQSADVAPVALSGLFDSLSGQSKIYDVVFAAYQIGSNVAVSATDTLGQMLGKLQAQINSKLNSTANAVSATKLNTARNINGVAFDGTANITIVDNTKEPSITSGTAAQYWRGDKTWQTLGMAALRGVGTGLTQLAEYTASGLSGFGYGIASWSAATEYATFADVPKRAGWFKVKDGSPATNGVPTAASLYGNNGIITPRHTSNYYNALFFPYYASGANSLVMRTQKAGNAYDAIIYSSLDPTIYNTNDTSVDVARFVTVQSTGEMRSVAPMPAQASSTATDIVTLRADFNDLLTKMRAMGALKT